MRLPLPASADVRRVGVEHELQVWRGEALVDFRAALPAVAGDIRALDPGDPRARRLPSGLALTADGWEAELATPPVRYGPGATRSLADCLRAERTELLAALRRKDLADGMTGFSTHVNVSVDDAEAVRLAREFARRCATALMTVTETDGSAGLLVRPRRNRLEVGCEYVEGDRLAFAVDFVVACVERLGREPLPPVTAEPVASREKFGYFVPASPAVVADVDALGRVTAWAGLDVSRLPSVPRSEDASRCSFGGRLAVAAGPNTAARVFDQTLHAETAWLTWGHVVWVITDEVTRRSVFAVLDARQEADFLTALDAGELTELIRRALSRFAPRRRLLVHAQLDGAALWHDLRPGALVPAERDACGAVPRVSRRAARRAA